MMCIQFSFGASCVLEYGTSYKTFLEHVKKLTSYVYFLMKEKVLLTEKHLAGGVTEDLIKRLKLEISTRCQSWLRAFLTYLSQ